MNDNDIKIGITGKILAGENKDWYIFVEHDPEKTGGYYIFLFNNFDKLKSSKRYDYWAEDRKILIQMCREAGWQIQWFNMGQQNYRILKNENP